MAAAKRMVKHSESETERSYQSDKLQMKKETPPLLGDDATAEIFSKTTPSVGLPKRVRLVLLHWRRRGRGWIETATMRWQFAKGPGFLI
jgi:hypothetical protein